MIKKINSEYILLFIITLVLLFNKGNRMLIMRLIERNQLRKNIIVLKTQNRYLKKKIFFLENNPYYLERIIRNELNMIAPGEIEYRFNLSTTVIDDEKYRINAIRRDTEI